MSSFFQSQSSDYEFILAHIDAFRDHWELDSIIFDESKISTVVHSMWAEFPAKGGIEEASTFKKAANFFCYFIAERPIISVFPREIVSDLSEIENHQNVMIAFDVVAKALDGATIIKSDDNIITLDKPLRLSLHSYKDLISSCRRITPSDHQHIIALLFEQISYRYNSNASNSIIDL